MRHSTKAVSKTQKRARIVHPSVSAKVKELLLNAVERRANVVHIEPRQNSIQVRFRIDGFLTEVEAVPKKLQEAYIGRLKLHAHLAVNEHHAVQEGSFTLPDAKGYHFKLSVIPITHGEKVVITIDDESEKELSLQQLGLWGKLHTSVQEACLSSRGLILITGPAGSGKATTLRALLSQFNTRLQNVATVENPVQKVLSGVNQTQINEHTGVSYQSALDVLLSQDANVIMIDQLATQQIAEAATQAAVDGTVMLSTVHASDTIFSLHRLLSMNLQPYLLAAGLRIVVAQKLVRRLCSACKVQYTPDSTQQKAIKRMLGLKSGETLNRLNLLEESALEAGMGSNRPALSTTNQHIKTFWKSDDFGCRECGGTGYNGRFAIFEILENTDKVQQLIMQGINDIKVQNQLREQLIISFAEDALVRACRGETSVEEVERALS